MNPGEPGRRSIGVPRRAPANRDEDGSGQASGPVAPGLLVIELEWQARGLSDEALPTEYDRTFTELKRLNERSVIEDLGYTNPRALFNMVRYAKHLGFWKGCQDNHRQLPNLEDLFCDVNGGRGS